MQNEKIAAIVLVVIVVGSLSVYLTVTYGSDILENLFGEKEEGVIALGDCVDVHYIGRYASNNTVFDSSYDDVENKTGGTPLSFFISLDSDEEPPEGYSGYMHGIEGFIEGLVGLKENDTKTIGPIPPEKAYGNYSKLKIGDIFSTSNLAIVMNQTVQVTNLTDEIISLKWVNVEDVGKFTMPQMIIGDLQSTDQNEMLIIPPPCYIWENSSEITNITDEAAIAKTTPPSSENISESVEPIQYGDKITFIFPDATTVVWNDTTITITSSPEVGKNYPYADPYSGGTVNFTLAIESIDIANDTINVSSIYEGEKSYQIVNTTISFDRTFSMPRLYNNIPLMYQMYFFPEEELNREGYSLNELTGESLIFEVEIVKVYKTS